MHVWPDAVHEIIRKLETMDEGIIGLVGLQGVGKSSALLAIQGGRTLLKDQEYDRTHESGKCPEL